MLSSIHPLGERARNNRWILTAVAFLVAATFVGAMAGAVLAGAGTLLPDGSWRWNLGVAAVVFAAALDLLKVQPPGPHRQVDEDWIGSFRGWVYGAGFGAQLGLGVATFVVTWMVWAVALLALLADSPYQGALIGGAFGLGRSVFPLAAGWIDRPSRLTDFTRQMSRLAIPATRGLAFAAILSSVLVIGLEVVR